MGLVLPPPPPPPPPPWGGGGGIHFNQCPGPCQALFIRENRTFSLALVVQGANLNA
jgi:hypothetical protein